MQDRFIVESRPRTAIRNPRSGTPNDPYFGIEELAYHVIDTRSGDSVESHETQEEARRDCEARNEAFNSM